jgi:hypothetical protein
MNETTYTAPSSSTVARLNWIGAARRTERLELLPERTLEKRAKLYLSFVWRRLCARASISSVTPVNLGQTGWGTSLHGGCQHIKGDLRKLASSDPIKLEGGRRI